MKICKNCNQIIPDKKEDYRGLCWNCYEKYLLEKVEHLGEKPPKQENFIQKFLKKFFH